MADELAGKAIGERIRELRGRLYTQRQLAERAGVSVDLVRKLEQGTRNTASVASLHRLARALDVTLADLMGRGSLPEHDQSEGVTALRFAVSGVDDLIGGLSVAVEPMPHREAGRTLTYLWGTYWAGKYDQLTALLPPALHSLRATFEASDGNQRAQAAELLARGYWVAGCALVHLRQSDAAFLAVRQAVAAADQSNDPLLAATLRGSVSWQLLVSGRYAESEALAVRTAETITPRGDVSFPDLSASLVLTAATAAARAKNGSRARDLVSESAEVADRMGCDRDDYQTAFGPSQVAMQTVDVGVQTGEFGQALTAARTMPNDGAALPLASRARHLTDRALAHTKLGQHEQAANLVVAAEQIAPDWAKHQNLIKSVTRDLLHTPVSRVPRLRGLAGRLGVR
ncbi:helix-turn-helix domain-containing protein [Saccharopolyspora sp. ASAGF58]|uniref:helix-turn-helix domain-containing protein n=1 Tax=Saccharopolyspora sp. ASAGF58 TaxID=2719023 RepID=UPI00144020BD|nr:helix-turn-helix transcriptional regulator [Saccharopolyspora sp. ASAGF58]QIZ38461.1 helix-turn-helix domain-containing protein [Saccharopolyspora sp. ASAGF58]